MSAQRLTALGSLLVERGTFYVGAALLFLPSEKLLNFWHQYSLGKSSFKFFSYRVPNLQRLNAVGLRHVHRVMQPNKLDIPIGEFLTYKAHEVSLDPCLIILHLLLSQQPIPYCRESLLKVIVNVTNRFLFLSQQIPILLETPLDV